MGEHHKKVENLIQSVNKALAVLRHVKSEGEFLNDMALIAQLYSFPKPSKKMYRKKGTKFPLRSSAPKGPEGMKGQGLNPMGHEEMKGQGPTPMGLEEVT